jgi:hypothetical protein
MSVPLPTWLTHATGAIRQLAERPWTLFFLLLALNAIGRPCSNSAHDARLYSLQALNAAENGVYSDDVFLRFGSQDQFSLFSRIAGPMTVAIGVQATFFFLYLVFNTLFIFGMFRLVRALIADSLVSTLALVYLVTASLPYGGGDIFTVHEQFFTPRLVGISLTLVALDALLRQRFALAAALLIAASLFHPLMAFGGVMIAAGYVACTYLPARVFAVLLITALLSGVAVLAIPTLGTRLFGEMDADWHDVIRDAVGYNYPDTWSYQEWLNVAVSFAVPIAACVCLYRADPVRRRFLMIVVLAGAVGLLATVAASLLPYALLFQAQPYRVLWILKVLQIPLGFALIAHGSQATALSARLAALALVGYFCILHGVPNEFFIVGAALAISIFLSYMSENPAPAGWWWYGAARGFAVGALLWMAYRLWFVVKERAVLAQHFDYCEWTMFDLLSPIFWLVGLFVAIRYWQPAPNFTVVRWAGAAIAVVAPIGLFAADMCPSLRRDHTRCGADVALVHDFIHKVEEDPARRPAIYWCRGRIDLVWTDVQATSYFSILQTAGVMFNRQTAEEIKRRIPLVAKFEMSRHRDEAIFLTDAAKGGMANLFKIPFEGPEPTEADLIRLCQEPGLDYVVITQEFPGLYSATNGRIFVYECYKVRSELSRLRLSARVAPGER